jgi:hypothetical protein
MARIKLTKWEKYDIERLRDAYLKALEVVSRAHGLTDDDVDTLLAHGELIACEGYMDSEQEPVTYFRL